MKKLIALSAIFIQLFAATVLAGLPPTSSKDLTDTSNITTFNYQFPNFTGTHTGTTFSLGVNGLAGGGTGNGSLAATSGGVLYTDGTKVQNTGGGSNTNVLTLVSGVPTWSAPAGGGSGTVTSVTMPSEWAVANQTTTPTFSRPPVNGTAKTTSYTLLSTDSTVYVNCSSACTITMPSPSSNAGHVYTLVDISSGTALVTISPSASEKFGYPQLSAIHMSTQGEAWTLASDSTNWATITHKTDTAPASYTMTVGATTTAPTMGTAGAITNSWERHNQNMLIRFRYSQTSASGNDGSGSYLYPIPSGYTINTSLVTCSASVSSSFFTSSIGSGGNYANSDAPQVTSELCYNSSNVVEYVENNSLSGSGNHGWGSSNQVSDSWTVVVPITNWEP